MTKTLENRIVELTAILYDSLEVRTRDNGEKFITMTDGVTLWAHDAIQAAHMGRYDCSPWDETRWAMVKSVIAKLSDYEPEHWADCETEMADALVDIFNIDLLGWVASSLNRYTYVEDACGEMGTPEDDHKPDFIKMLMYGQFEEYREIMASITDSVRTKAQEQMEAAEAGDEQSIVEGDTPTRAVELDLKKVPIAIPVKAVNSKSKVKAASKPKKGRKPKRK